ncbi:MAG: hypothetical protein ABI365_04505 [Lysobacteraceae bacterium]
MRLMRIAVVLAIAACFSVAAGPSYPQQGKKLYHWVSADGKDHYSDVLPPEALTEARQEISAKSGVTIKQINRALTPEERAVAAVQTADAAKAAAAAAEAEKNDQVLLSSYPTEKDLQRAYDQRTALQIETLKSIRIGMESQQQSLSTLLANASNRELANMTISPPLAASIQTTHQHVLEQQALLVRQEAQSVALSQEAASTIARYRALRAAADAGVKPETPANPTNPSPSGD